MTYRSSKSIKLVKQCMPLEGVLNFNVDRVTRGKPGPTDIEGVLCDFKGEVLINFFFQMIGIKDSSKAKVLAILEALRIYSRSSTRRLIVESGSFNAIISWVSRYNKAP